MQESLATGRGQNRTLKEVKIRVFPSSTRHGKGVRIGNRYQIGRFSLWRTLVLQTATLPLGYPAVCARADNIVVEALVSSAGRRYISAWHKRFYKMPSRSS